MAKYHVLGTGYDYDYYPLATAKWTNYDIEFDFADSFAQSKALLSIKDYFMCSGLAVRRLVWFMVKTAAVS